MADDEDKVQPLKPGQKPDLKGMALNALTKARQESFKKKVEDKTKLLLEAQKAAKLIEKEIEELIAEFEEGL